MPVGLSLLIGCAPPDTDWREPSGSVRVELADPVTCAEPLGREVRAFDRAELGPAPSRPEAELVGSGFVVADLNGDDRPDLFVPDTLPALYVGTADGLATAPWTGPSLPDAVGASAADVEGDGDLDLLVTRWSAPIVLLANDGQGGFLDVTGRSGLGLEASHHTAAAWGDQDGDGDLDLFVGTYGEAPGESWAFDDPDVPPSTDPKRLWENLGDGTFRDASDRLPPEVRPGYTFQATWADVDRDGLPELFVWNDFGTAHPSLALHNDGARLTFTPGSGIDRGFEDMGVAVADLDGDELPDFATTSFRKLGLLTSLPVPGGLGAAWVDSADARGLATAPDQAFGWGAAFGDLDHDRDEDLAVTFGFWSRYPNDLDPRWQQDGLFVQDADGAFSDQALGWEVYEPFVGRGLLLADVDGNGFLDLAKRFLDAPLVLHLGRCDPSAWTRVSLRQEGPNPFAIGARITTISADGTRQTRWLTAGGTSLFVGEPPEVHVGLGDEPSVDLEVLWPDGEVTEVHDVPTRRGVRVLR